ncbi:hypothetical protein [Arthrobacter sp.]|uniref:hypothetical protein n=1 Tax=Arthrobacter sp. TaxID=1667 RepID=UPI00289E1D30|nr:hypothetical protein [Arthrobacter sp.]
MRAKVLSILGVSALLLCGCTQAASVPEPVRVTPVPEDPLVPTHPADENFLGSVSGSGSSSAGFGPAGAAVAVYLACQSDGELVVNVANTGKTSVACGTPEEPTRTVFELDSPVAKLFIDVESDDVLAWGLTVTDAGG